MCLDSAFFPLFVSHDALNSQSLSRPPNLLGMVGKEVSRTWNSLQYFFVYRVQVIAATCLRRLEHHTYDRKELTCGADLSGDHTSTNTTVGGHASGIFALLLQPLKPWQTHIPSRIPRRHAAYMLPQVNWVEGALLFNNENGQSSSPGWSFRTNFFLLRTALKDPTVGFFPGARHGPFLNPFSGTPENVGVM